MSLGVPIKLIHEGEGNNVTIELKNGEVYRGLLNSSEDNMNCQLSNVTLTSRDGRTSRLQQVFLRGSMIRFIVLPDNLKNSPLLLKIRNPALDNTKK